MRLLPIVALAAACSPSAAPTPSTTTTAAAPDASEVVIAGPITKPAAPVASQDDCPAGKGKTYEVGDGKKYTSIGAVPWERLSAGDRVLIHHRQEPYREKILLSQRGTRDQPIRVCGVAGDGGALPVISGENATTRKESIYPYPPTQERGLVIVTPREGYRWGEKPEHILIQGLELRSAWRGPDEKNPRTFKDNEGKDRPYSGNAAAIFIERGENITVRNCILTDSGYGFFVASADTEEVVSRDILVENSYIHGNGYAGVDRRHNIYSEALGITYQGNRFGPLRPGARGNQLKDRSAGTVIRYNWIEGGAHLLDLVEPEESVAMSLKDPRYHDTWVYGNIMISGPEDGSSLIHYGGDNGKESTYRKGTLHFFHNTVVVEADAKKRWNTTIFRVETNDETVDARNNVFVRKGTTNLFLMKTTGKLVLGRNWISNGYGQFQYADKADGKIEGEENLIKGDDPAFADGELRVGAKSPLAAKAGPLPKDLPADHAITRQYVPHQTTEPRAATKTLGAYEAR